MKKFIKFIIWGVIFGCLFGALFSLFFSKKSASPVKIEGITLFYAKTCPHCKKVEKYLKKKNIEIEKKEVFHSKENRKLLFEAAKKCGIRNNIGVPFLYIKKDKKCIIGDNPIINYFEKKL